MAASKTQKLSGNNFIIVMLLITLLVVGVSGLVVKSLFTTIGRDLKVVTAKSKADKQLKENLEAAPRLVDAYHALGPEKVLLENALPNAVDFPSLLVVVENMTGAAGLKLKTIGPTQGLATGDTAAAGTTASASAPMPQPYDFTLTFDGTYDALQRFLAEVELSARPMRVVSFQLNGSSHALSGQIDLETYYQDRAQLPLSKETIK